MRRQWTRDELADHWSLTPKELELLANKSGAMRLGFAVLLKERATVRKAFLIVLALAVLPLATPTQPAAAASLGTTIHLDVAGPLSLNAEERASILQGTQATVNFYRGKTAWRCIGNPYVFDELDPDALPPLSRTPVHIDVLVGRAQDGSEGATILVEIEVVGKKSAGRLVTVPEALLEGDRSAALRAGAERALAESMDKVAPCVPKVKMKTRTRVNSQGLIWENSTEGEARLALLEDGSFNDSVPATRSWSPMSLPVGQCTFAAESQDVWPVAGEFDSSDGTLRFMRLEMHAFSGTITADCTLGGQRLAQTMPVPAIPASDVAKQFDVRVVLQNGAQTTLQVPTGGGIASEFTIDLSYDEEPAADVAVVLIREG